MAIRLPSSGEVMDLMKVADPDSVYAVRTFIRKELALQLKEQFLMTVRGISFKFFFNLWWVSNLTKHLKLPGKKQ